MMLKELNIGDVVPTPDNPRKISKKCPKLAELAESIKNHGLLHPVIVREHPTEAGKYDLRAGERRFLALKSLEAETIMANVLELSDEQAREITAVENCQRDDLSPLEEAASVDLLRKNGRSLEEIADKLGKSVAWASRRAKLLDLSPEWKKALADPESSASEWPATHLELIAALPKDAQNELFGYFSDFNRVPTRNSLRAAIAERTHALDQAQWPLDDADLVKNKPCSACIDRSDVQPDLFDDADMLPQGVCVVCGGLSAERGGEINSWEWTDDTDTVCEKCEGKKPKKKYLKRETRCLDSACWKAKMDAWLLRRIEQLRSERGDVTLLGLAHDKCPEFDSKVINPYYVTTSETKKRGYTPGIFVSGPEAGLEVWIKPEKANAAASGNGSSGNGPTPLAEKEAKLERNRQKLVTDSVLNRMHETARALADGVDVQSLPLLTLEWEAFAALMLTFGIDAPFGAICDAVDRAEETPDTEVRCLAAAALIESMSKHLEGLLRGDNPSPEYQLRSSLLPLLGIDPKPLWEKACEEKPEPKSWAKQREQEAASV